MQTTVNIGSSESFQLHRAILIYGTDEHRCVFATLHDVVRPKNGDVSPTLGVARLLTTEFIRELVKGLGKDTILEVLPENVLARNEYVTAWWVPKTHRVLFFHENSELAALSGKKFPTPALVFKVAGGHLSVRGLAGIGRPNAGSALEYAPFWNVYPDGKICHGTMRVPDGTSLKSLPDWEHAFFGSNFSHTIRDDMTRHKKGTTGLWTELADQTVQFPSCYLKPCGQTLEDFVTHV
jgi:PRTRC genetic system protein B